MAVFSDEEGEGFKGLFGQGIDPPAIHTLDRPLTHVKPEVTKLVYFLS